MTLFRNKYRIETTRLKDFDYSQVADYYVTICVDDRIKVFGTIENGKIQLNSSGELAAKIWKNLETDYKFIKLEDYVIMPEHMHGTIRIGKKTGITLSRIIQAYKSKSTIAINKSNPKNTTFKWQKGFFDRVIRDDKEFYFVTEYIKNNPIMTDPANYYKEWWELQQMREDEA